MKLEQAIKQTKPFQNEMQKLFINIQYTSNWLNASFGRVLKPFEITPHQYNVLRILKGKHPESYCNHQIAERMLDQSSNATRIVDKLLKKNLILRTESEIDRRLVEIKITDQGLKLIETIELGIETFKEKFTVLEEAKAKLMNDWLDELRG